VYYYCPDCGEKYLNLNIPSSTPTEKISISVKGNNGTISIPAGSDYTLTYSTHEEAVDNGDGTTSYYLVYESYCIQYGSNTISGGCNGYKELIRTE